MTTTEPTGGDQRAAADRPLRADARRNRARVLQAAEEVFADKGVTASTEEIAKRAGVGIGTVFRHFPTKESLLEAVLVGRMRRLAEGARELSEAVDPSTAFFEFFHSVVDHAASKAALADALAGAGIDPATAVADVADEARRAIEVLLDRARQAGAVRSDLGVAEVFALLVGASRAAEYAGTDQDLAARVLAIVFDGMRPRPGR
jgi:AcrR family transcriptional regulator